MSGIRRKIGKNHLPKPPIKIGITKKKIIINACAVIIPLNNAASPMTPPPCVNSKRIKNLRPEPTNPAHTPKIKYKEPISLCLVEATHRWGQRNPTLVTNKL